MRTIEVPLGDRSYPIHVGHEILSRVPELLAERLKTRRVFLVTDRNVARHYGDLVESLLVDERWTVASYVLPPGEKTKSLRNAARLYDAMIDHSMDRRSAVIALGGGVVGDLAGFVAATYMRGIPFVQIPTTLLAQVDSSVGGKVAVNHKKGKNLIGAFHQPAVVVADVSTLRTLPKREVRSGLAEVVKYGVILDDEFFACIERDAEKLLRLDPDALEHIISRSCELKAQVVAKDEREADLRAILNYGHTVGHAIEATAGYGIVRHGEAVSLGMIAATHIALTLGMVGEDVLRRQRELLQRLKLPVAFQAPSMDPVLKVMYHDKKVRDGRLRFVLPTRIGEVVLRDVSETQVKRALQQICL